MSLAEDAQDVKGQAPLIPSKGDVKPWQECLLPVTLISNNTVQDVENGKNRDTLVKPGYDVLREGLLEATGICVNN